MHFSRFRAAAVFFIASALIPGAVSWCRMIDGDDDDRCEWLGTAPYCGKTSLKIGDTDNKGRHLLACYQISKECYDDYGSGCHFGYKRLWCWSTKPKPEEPTPTDPNEIPDYDPHDGFGDLESNVFAGTTHGVRSRESVVIDIELN
ncbi:hypothetical protein ACEPPN_000052 [Leptodophora sp. 'Broadleaf-Isolate-01']